MNSMSFHFSFFWQSTLKYYFGVKYHELAIFLDYLIDNLATRGYNNLLTVLKLKNGF